MNFNIEKHYPDLIESLRMKIISEYGSVTRFCVENGFSRFTLSRVFNGHRNISVSLYLELNSSLFKLPPGGNIEIDHNLTLIEYMKINHDMVVSFILEGLSNS